jgi:hypothetical protein
VPTAQANGDSILAGGIILYTNGAYAISWLQPSYYFGNRDQIVGTDSGSWSIAGGQLSLLSTIGQSRTGSYDPTSLSIESVTDTWTFARR